MARFDGATWNPQGATPGGAMDPRVVIFHVTAVEGTPRPHSGLEWHFHVSYSGQVDQLVDTNLQAAANYKANPFAISIETEGLGGGEWTDAQLDALVAISEWCMAHHPRIRRQRCPTWDGSGFGYHVMFGAPGPWTPVAKSCPGANRIRQFDEVLLPRILNQEDDMPLNDDDKRWIRSQLGVDSDLTKPVSLVGSVSDAVKNITGVLIPGDNLLGHLQTDMKNIVAGIDIDVDEAAIASAVAQLVNRTTIAKLSDDDFDRIAKEVADEQARRLAG